MLDLLDKWAGSIRCFLLHRSHHVPSIWFPKSTLCTKCGLRWGSRDLEDDDEYEYE